MVIETEDFARSLKRLPAPTQRLYHVQRERFIQDQRDSRLHTKKLNGLDDVFSLRVTRNYRVLFYFHTSDTAIFFIVGNRKDVYKNL